MSAIALDPLIAEAQERARRRRLLALLAVVLIAATAIRTAHGLRSSTNALGVCATAAGFAQKFVSDPSLGPRARVLTNFRFGQVDDFYGLGASTGAWPAGGVMIAVLNEGPAAHPRFGTSLRVSSADFGGFEGMGHPFAQRAIRSNGRVLDAFIEVGSVTPATIAAADQALAGIRTCSA